MVTLSVGIMSLPENEIVGIIKLEDGNFKVSYEYDPGDIREVATINPMNRDDVRELIARRPELLKTVVESVPTVQAIETIEVPAKEEEKVISPSVAVNVQGERFFLAVSPQSHSAFDQCWKESRLPRVPLAKTPLPTTEQVMIWNLKQCNARRQEDGSWSLPPRVTLDILEDCLSFDVVKEHPEAVAIDPLIHAHMKYSSNISGY